MAQAQKDYYFILGVPRTITTRDLQKVFRELAKQYHPDRVGAQGTPAFQDIVEAYQVLSDPERRDAYHQALLAAEAVQRARPEPMLGGSRSRVEPLIPEPSIAPPGFGPEPLLAEPLSILHDFATMSPSFETLRARFLSNFTGIGLSKSGRATALNVEVLLSPDETRRGGMIRLGVPVFTRCSFCAGTGRDWFSACLACQGQGMNESEANVPVRIPPNVPSGSILEVPLHQLGISNVYLRLHIRTLSW
jgi:DnaJ-domain-containing protein 1